MTKDEGLQTSILDAESLIEVEPAVVGIPERLSSPELRMAYDQGGWERTPEFWL